MKFINNSRHTDALLRYLTSWVLQEIDVDPKIITEIRFENMENYPEYKHCCHVDSTWKGFATWNPQTSKPHNGHIRIWLGKKAPPKWRVRFPFVWKRNNIREAICEAIAHEALHVHFRSDKHMRIYRAERFIVKRYRKKHS